MGGTKNENPNMREEYAAWLLPTERPGSFQQEAAEGHAAVAALVAPAEYVQVLNSVEMFPLFDCGSHFLQQVPEDFGKVFVVDDSQEVFRQVPQMCVGVLLPWDVSAVLAGSPPGIEEFFLAVL